MSYNKKTWMDHIQDEEGNIIQQGTPISAENLNNIENGISENTEQLLTLMQHSTVKSGLDDEGIFTIVELKRQDNTLYCKSELYEGESPCYLKRKESYYSLNGSTLIKEINYSRIYNEDEQLISEVIA